MSNQSLNEYYKYKNTHPEEDLRDLVLDEAADWAGYRVQDLEKELIEAKQEITRLESLCGAAAEEIEENWNKLCDEEGYGPCNLLNRLKGNIGGGYTGPYVDELIEKTVADAKKANEERDAAIATIKKFQEYMVQLIKDTPIKYSKDGSFPEPLCAILAWSESK